MLTRHMSTIWHWHLASNLFTFFVFKTENNELTHIRLNDEGIMLPDCHSQWHHSKSNELVLRRENHIILPKLLLGLWWWLTPRLSKGQSLLITTVLLKTSLTRPLKKLIRPIFLVINGVLYFFSLFPILTRSYSRNAAHTHCYFVVGDFDFIFCSFRKLRIMQMETILLRFLWKCQH